VLKHVDGTIAFAGNYTATFTIEYYDQGTSAAAGITDPYGLDVAELADAVAG